MRYYVLVDDSENPPSILGEVLREDFDDGRYRDSSLASPLAGANAKILTQAELMTRPEWQRALRDWLVGLEPSAGNGPHLATVIPIRRHSAPIEPHQLQSRAREACAYSYGVLRPAAQAAVERARILRARLLESRSLKAGGQR